MKLGIYQILSEQKCFKVNCKQKRKIMEIAQFIMLDNKNPKYGIIKDLNKINSQNNSDR